MNIFGGTRWLLGVLDGSRPENTEHVQLNSFYDDVGNVKQNSIVGKKEWFEKYHSQDKRHNQAIYDCAYFDSIWNHSEHKRKLAVVKGKINGAMRLKHSREQKARTKEADSEADIKKVPIPSLNHQITLKKSVVVPKAQLLQKMKDQRDHLNLTSIKSKEQQDSFYLEARNTLTKEQKYLDAYEQYQRIWDQKSNSLSSKTNRERAHTLFERSQGKASNEK